MLSTEEEIAEQSETVATVALSTDERDVRVGGATSTGNGRSAAERAPATMWSEPVARALHTEEIHRARGWATALFVLIGCALAFLPLLPGTVGMKTLFSFSLLILGATTVWVWVRVREEGRYTATAFRIFGFTAATVSFELEYFLGAFSPTPLVVTLGVTFFGMGMDRKYALIIPLYAIVGYFILTLLMTLDVISDPGAISAEGTPQLTRLFFTFMAPLVLSVTLWMARLSRRTMADAMQQAADATRLAGERAAQLDEARAELEQMLRAGAGGRGRYTGARADRYELAELVGRGAMGEVYAAKVTGTDLRAAIKVLRPDAMRKPNILARFLREGELAGGLDVPNIVAVHGIGTLDDGVPYIAMELLSGDDLAAELRRKNRLERGPMVSLMKQVARGLDAAHAAGIVHRDLKPQNIFGHRDNGPEPTWKILDFGVSKLARSQGTLTQHAVVGTPGYMAPEQARGEDVDRRCDIFALGAVAYRCITGRPPFSGSDMPQILFDIVYRMPLRPGSLVDGLHRDVDRVLSIALTKARELRFDSAGAFADALEDAYAGKLDKELRHRADAQLDRCNWGESTHVVDR